MPTTSVGSKLELPSVEELIPAYSRPSARSEFTPDESSFPKAVADDGGSVLTKGGTSMEEMVMAGMEVPGLVVEVATTSSEAGGSSVAIGT